MPAKKDKIKSYLMLSLLMIFAFLYICFDFHRTSQLKDGGLVRMSAYNLHSCSTYIRYGATSSSSHLDFRFTIDGETYYTSINTESLNKGENYIIDLDGVNTISRYVLYSKDFSIAYEEHVSLGQYKFRRFITYFLILLSIVLITFVPRFIAKRVYSHPAPIYKKNPHKKETDLLVYWPNMKYRSIAFLWSMFYIVTFLILLLLFVAQISWGYKLALIFILSPISLTPVFLFRMLRKNFLAIYPDEIVMQQDIKKLTIYKKQDITAYHIEQKADGTDLGYKFFTPDGPVLVPMEHFEREKLDAFLLKHQYIVSAS